VLHERLAHRLDRLGRIEGGFDDGTWEGGDCQSGRDDAMGTLARVSVTICEVGRELPGQVYRAGGFLTVAAQ
jgi:hypothetical protein